MTNVCLIVGAGPGIGQACAIAFAREGYDIALAARRPEHVQALAADVAENTGQRARGYCADAADFDSLRRLHAAVSTDFGDPDVLIYNAATSHRGRPTQIDANSLAADFQANVGGALVCAQLVAPAMRAHGRGSILFTGGGFAHEPAAGFASLSASKAALRSLTFTLAQDLGAHGIHVATVTVYGVVQTGTAFDPARIAQRFLVLHRQRRGQFDTEVVYK